jgi:hypothetical protein
MDFPRHRERQERPAKGESFLTAAKTQFHELFSHYLEIADEFSSIETYTAALEADAWKLCEQLSKQSWHNGIERGQDRGRRGQDR